MMADAVDCKVVDAVGSKAVVLCVWELTETVSVLVGRPVPVLNPRAVLSINTAVLSSFVLSSIFVASIS
jgi:hypothetical protein